MSEYSFKISNDFTCIDNIFIDKYMINVPQPIFSLIYIYTLRCARDGIGLSSQMLSQIFGILESDVIKAWEYWEEKNVIKFDVESDCLTFLSLNKNDEVNIRPAVIQIGNANRKLEHLPTDDEQAFKDNEDIARLSDIVQEKFGNVSNSFYNKVIDIYDQLGFGVEAIACILEFTKSKGARIDYATALAKDLHQKGIIQVDEIATYFDSIDPINNLLKSFGIVSGRLTSNQRNTIYEWKNIYKMTDQMIKLACERAVDAGVSSLSYVNGIIKRWQRNGISTPELAEMEKKEHEKNISAKSVAQPVKNNVVGKRDNFNNYQGATYTEEEKKRILQMKRKV